MARRCALLLGCILLLGCAAQRHDDGDAILRASHQTRELTRRFGVVEAPGADRYLAEIVDRLTASYPDRFAGRTIPQVTVLKTLEPIAVSPGNGTVILSRGLIFHLQNEAQLAFIIAHELGHAALAHTSDPDLSSDERRSLEIAADSFGIALMALAGYDPRPALQALAHLHRSTTGWTTDPNYPDFTSRLATLQTTLATAGWQPPGTVDRRDFRKLHAALCASPPRASGGVCGPPLHRGSRAPPPAVPGLPR